MMTLKSTIISENENPVEKVFLPGEQLHRPTDIGHTSIMLNKHVEPQAKGARRSFKNICVFCGSSNGKRDEYAIYAKKLGEELVRRNIALVYGGGDRGIMGHIASTVLENNGSVTGIIPRAIFDICDTVIGETIIVKDMHARKLLMNQMSDAFVVLPGGFGTMEELMEVATWSQLGIHDKPVVILNVNGYYDKFLDWIKHSIAEEFTQPRFGSVIVECSSIEELFGKLETYVSPPGYTTWPAFSSNSSDEASKSVES